MVQAMPLNTTVSITAFNRGKAGQIFSNVKKLGMTVVMKNNEPECVLLSPAQYEALLEAQYDAELLSVADLADEELISFEDVCKKTGISMSELDDTEEVEFE